MKDKTFKIILIAIIIVETIGLVVLGVKYNNLKNNKTNSNINNASNIEKKYVGIYHATYSNGTQANITIKEDNTCEFPNYGNNDYANCKYEEEKDDKLKITISYYVPKYSFENGYTSQPWGNTKEKCNEKIQNEHDFEKNSCKEIIKEFEITLVNNGLLYQEIQYTKIK